MDFNSIVLFAQKANSFVFHDTFMRAFLFLGLISLFCYVLLLAAQTFSDSLRHKFWVFLKGKSGVFLGELDLAITGISLFVAEFYVLFAHDIFLFVVAYFAARKTTSFLYSLYRKMRFSVPSYSEDEHGCTCHKCGKDIVSRFAQYLSVKCCDCSMWQQVYSMEERDVTTPGFLVDKIESKEAVIQDGLHWVGFTDPKARDGKF